MQLWYALWNVLPLEMFHWDFMKNALLAVLLIAPLFGLMSTMIVTGRMSFFSDALGHSAFTGIAIGCICGVASPTWVAVLLSAAAATRPLIRLLVYFPVLPWLWASLLPRLGAAVLPNTINI